VCSNDLTALRVMNALSVRGLEVPRDVAVTGFDGLVAGRMSTPALTTVRQPMVEMGRAVVDILINQLNAPGDVPEQRQLKATFVQRQSCGCSF
jgi:DNA-binding LacI/PurR family transcriptional regulator